MHGPRPDAARPGAPRPARLRPAFMLCAATLLAALLLGGRAKAGVLSDVALQCAALPLFVLSASWLAGQGAAVWRSTPVLLSLAALALPLLQLLPLPPTLWTALPSHAAVLETLDVAGIAPGWFPLSLTPGATLLSALWLMPCVALFWGVLRLDAAERRALSLVVIGAGVASAVLGVVQAAQAGQGPHGAVGLFANRNHFAAFLCVALVFAGAWLATIAARWQARGVAGNLLAEGALVAASAAALACVVVLVAAVLLTRSRAGVALLVGGLAGLAAMTRSASRAGDPRATNWSLRAVLGVTGFALAFALPFTVYGLWQRFEVDPLDDARLAFARNTIVAARAMLPFGSGLGSFVPVYAMVEPASDAFEAYANHAHNDVLQLWLEAGVPGLVLLGGALGWLAARARAAWPRPGAAASLDAALQGAALLTLGLLALHALVDFSLRTASLAAIASLACAYLCPPAAPHPGRDPLARSRLIAALVGAPQRRRRTHRSVAPGPARPAASPSGLAWPAQGEAGGPDAVLSDRRSP